MYTNVFHTVYLILSGVSNISRTVTKENCTVHNTNVRKRDLFDHQSNSKRQVELKSL